MRDDIAKVRRTQVGITLLNSHGTVRAYGDFSIWWFVDISKTKICPWRIVDFWRPDSQITLWKGLFGGWVLLTVEPGALLLAVMFTPTTKECWITLTICCQIHWCDFIYQGFPRFPSYSSYLLKPLVLKHSLLLSGLPALSAQGFIHSFHMGYTHIRNELRCNYRKYPL